MPRMIVLARSPLAGANIWRVVRIALASQPLTGERAKMDLRTAEARSSGTEADHSVRHDWTRAEAQALYDAPFNDLLFYGSY